MFDIHVIYGEKLSPFSIFALYASDNLVCNSPSIRDFSCTLYNAQELRRHFVDAIHCMRYSRKLLSVSLQASVKFERPMI